MVLKCITCHERLTSEENFSKFPCPACLEVDIVRCEKCRRRSNVYVCPKCGFEGP